MFATLDLLTVAPGYLLGPALLVVLIWGLAGGTNQVFRLLDRFKEQPRPMDTYQMKGDYVKRSECRELHASAEAQVKEIESELESIRIKLEHDKTEVLRADEERSVRLHSRIEEMRHEFKEDLRGVHLRINRLAEEMPTKVVELLRRTKGLL